MKRMLTLILAVALLLSTSLSYAVTNTPTAPVGNVPQVLVVDQRTGLTASLAATTIYTTTAAGLYRVCQYAVITAVGTGAAQTNTANVLFNNGAAQTASTPAVTGLTAFAYGTQCFALQLASGIAIQVSTTDGGTVTTHNTFSLYTLVEQY